MQNVTSTLLTVQTDFMWKEKIMSQSRSDQPTWDMVDFGKWTKEMCERFWKMGDMKSLVLDEFVREIC